MRIVLCSDQAEGRDSLRQIALNTGFECAADDCVTVRKLLPRLVLGNCDLVLVQMSTPEVGLEAIRSAAQKTTVPVLAIGPTTDPQVILEAQRAGARQFLDQSHARDELVNAIEKLHRADAFPFRRGKTIAVTAAIPGTGVTTVASGLAFALAVKHPKQVVLMELGADIPELALDLDLQPPHTLSQVLRDWDRMDASTVRQALLEHPAGVQVLADPPGTIASIAHEAAPCKQVIALLRAIRDYTVIDLGHGALGPASHEALKIAETVVVVVRLDVPSLRLTKLYLNKLADVGVPAERIYLAVNRYGQRRQLPWRKAEDSLGMPVQAWLPDDPGTLNTALNQGTPLVQTSRRARITRRFDQMAKSLNGAPPR